MTTRPASLLLVGIVSLLASACATGDLLSNRVDVAGVKYDAQECVEHALHNRPDAAAVRDGAVAFAQACRDGEAASCSVLGVMYELGQGFPVDTLRAQALYRAACASHNERACGNLGDLLRRSRQDSLTAEADRTSSSGGIALSSGASAR